MHGGRAWGVAGVLAVVMVLTGCDRPIRAQPPVDKVPPLEAAVERSRAAGNARTTTTPPDGFEPRSRISAVADFRGRRSATLIEIVRDDGQVLPYVRIVRTPESQYVGGYPSGATEPQWQRFDASSSESVDPPVLDVDAAGVLTEVEHQQADLVPNSSDARMYRRLTPAPTGPDNAVGLVVLSVRLGDDDRVATVEFTLPALRAHGAFTMAFSDYGNAPPVEVPDV